MAKLNEKNEKTKKIIHLMVTSLCDRDCPHCCNKQYDLNEIPYMTNEELSEADTVFITGGEPFKYSEPVQIAKYLRNEGIENVYVYTNAYEFFYWYRTIDDCSKILEFDGLNISIKNGIDRWAIIQLCNRIEFFNLIDSMLGKSRIYDFVGIDNTELVKHFNYFKREWQEDFEAADDSIFRKI